MALLDVLGVVVLFCGTFFVCFNLVLVVDFAIFFAMFMLMCFVQNYIRMFLTFGSFKKWEVNSGSTPSTGPVINRA